MSVQHCALVLLVVFIGHVSSRSLQEVICSHTQKCKTFSEPSASDVIGVDVNPAFRPSSRSPPPPSPSRHLQSTFPMSPSFAEQQRWANYETMEQGTGLMPDSGPGWGPGLGDIDIRTGLGVQYGVGSLGIRRDFGISMGGSGRSGGIPFGWGNGYQRLTGAAPWANP